MVHMYRSQDDMGKNLDRTPELNIVSTFTVPAELRPDVTAPGRHHRLRPGPLRYREGDGDGSVQGHSVHGQCSSGQAVVGLRRNKI